MYVELSKLIIKLIQNKFRKHFWEFILNNTKCIWYTTLTNVKLMYYLVNTHIEEDYYMEKLPQRLSVRGLQRRTKSSPKKMPPKGHRGFSQLKKHGTLDKVFHQTTEIKAIKVISESFRRLLCS